MLQQVLDAIEAAPGPVLLAELGRQLGVEPSALAGMVAFWAQKGKLQRNGEAVTAVTPTCTCTKCDPAAPTNCAYVVRLPDTFSVNRNR